MYQAGQTSDQFRVHKPLLSEHTHCFTSLRRNAAIGSILDAFQAGDIPASCRNSDQKRSHFNKSHGVAGRYPKQQAAKPVTRES